MKPNKKKYLVVFMITSGIFLVVFMFVSFLNTKKTDTISQLQQKITVDLLATETQFSLLKNAPCKAIGNSILSKELGEMGEKLSFMETTQEAGSDNVLQLKKYYSLLQVKDYLLMQEVAQKCDIQTDSIVYFYEKACPECVKQGYVLTELKRQYPWLRIYSFDRELDFSLIETFEGLYEVGSTYPALIIGDDVYSGFHGVEDVEAYIPELQKKKEIELIQESSLEYLLDHEEFQEISDLVFLNVQGDIVTYTYMDVSVGGDTEEQVILLTHDKDKKTYSVYPTQE